MERPCVRLSFSSLGGFWDPNLTSWRSFAVRLRFSWIFNFRVLRGFHSISRQHRPNSGFPLSTQRDWTMCGWNSKGSSQLLDLHFQFLIQRSSVLLTDPPCSSYVAHPNKNPGSVDASCFRDNRKKGFLPSIWVRGVSQYGHIRFGSTYPSFGDF